MNIDDEKVVSIFSMLTKEIDDLPKEDAIAICKNIIEALQKEIFSLMKQLAAKEHV